MPEKQLYQIRKENRRGVLNLHEYQAKEVLDKFGIPIPKFVVAAKQHEIEHAINELKLSQAVIKIQVHAGGRGKGGGVQFAKTPDEIRKMATQLIGMRLVNEQTGKEGVIAHKVLLSSPVDIKKEYYLGAVIDRAAAVPIIIASPEGGMEIEEIAAKSPKKILKIPIQFNGSVRSYHLLRLAKFMGWQDDLQKQGIAIVRVLAKAFIETDAALLEINPLVLDPQGKLWALDAKLAIDDNALYRQPHLAQCFDPTQISKEEVEAKQHDLAYIALDGHIGCMVNGAGLAMATMDLIQHAGSKPANFLDVGGSATVEKIAAGFKILLSDSRVRAILVNIFGGIMNCETIAEGILSAAKERSIHVPLVVRMEGTNVEKGEAMLKQSALKVSFAKSLQEAAEKIVEATHGHSHR